MSAREESRLRREEASRKMTEEAAAKLRGNSVVKVVRQARGPVRAIAYDAMESALIVACVDNTLWRSKVGKMVGVKSESGAHDADENAAWRSVSEWQQIGCALNVTAHAVLAGYLFAVDRSNTLWRRTLGESPTIDDWTHWGKLGTKKESISALTASSPGAADPCLFAATTYGKLFRIPAEANSSWTLAGEADRVKALANCVDGRTEQLFAMCTAGDLYGWRISEKSSTAATATAWRALGEPDLSVVVANGICTSESLLFGSDSTSLICCDLSALSQASGTTTADGEAVEPKATAFWRCMPLPPVEMSVAKRFVKKFPKKAVAAQQKAAQALQLAAELSEGTASPAPAPVGNKRMATDKPLEPNCSSKRQKIHLGQPV